MSQNLSSHIKVTTANGSLVLALTDLVQKKDGDQVAEVEASKLVIGDILVITGQGQEETREEPIVEVSAELTVEELRIEQLEARVKQLEASAIHTNDVLLRLQNTIVELTADHIQRLFSDEVLLDSIATRIFVAGANAINYKVKASNKKAPELVVIEGYLPGALRAKLEESGEVVIEIEDSTNPGNWLSGEFLTDKLKTPEVRAIFGDLLIAYGAEVGRHYFIMDSHDVEEARKKTATMAAQVLAADEQATPAEEAKSIH